MPATPRRSLVRHNPHPARASQPVTAAAIADEPEVTVRTLYGMSRHCRRVASRSWVQPAPGMCCSAGYELPPLMFTEDEAEGIAVGVRLLARTPSAVRFALDSPVEEAGFEPPVPPGNSVAFTRRREGRRPTGWSRKLASPLRGTSGSNPARSSGESPTNRSQLIAPVMMGDRFEPRADFLARPEVEREASDRLRRPVLSVARAAHSSAISYRRSCS